MPLAGGEPSLFVLPDSNGFSPPATLLNLLFLVFDLALPASIIRRGISQIPADFVLTFVFRVEAAHSQSSAGN